MGLKYDNANIVNERDSNTVCINHIRFENELFPSKSIGPSWHIDIEFGIDVEGLYVT
jgi:hypothetical protein